jgi:hypothetical protein
MHGELHHRYRDSFQMVAAGGTPVAQKAYGPVPQGYEWYVEIVAYSVTGNSHTAAFDLAVGPDNGDLPAQATWDHAGMVWTSPALVRNSENTGPPFFMDVGEFIHAYASGGTLAAADVVVVTYQIAVYEKEPLWGLLTPEERAELAADRERLRETAPIVAESAVAGERAV